MATRGRPESRSSFQRNSPKYGEYKSPRSNDARPRKPQFHSDVAKAEEELASKSVVVQTKRFYVDVKQNLKGEFIKITEVNNIGSKKRVIFSMSTAAIFRDYLDKFSEHCSTLGPKSESVDTSNDTLKSEVINRDERRYYYLDLKENARGRYLRVCMTIPLSRQRFHIAVPAQGMTKVKDALSELLREFGTDEEEGFGLPGPKTMRVENKLFYFDVGQNKNGIFMRISEVRNNYRTAITLPDKCWTRFRDILCEFTPRDPKEEISLGSMTARTDALQRDLEKLSLGDTENEGRDSESFSSVAESTGMACGIADSISEALAVEVH